METSAKLRYVLGKIEAYPKKDKRFAKEAMEDRKKFYSERSDQLEKLEWSKIKSHPFFTEISSKITVFEKKDVLKRRVEKLERHAYAPELNTLWFKSGRCRQVYQCTSIDAAIDHLILHGISLEMCRQI